jgi:hypothetical protein
LTSIALSANSPSLAPQSADPDPSDAVNPDPSDTIDPNPSDAVMPTDTDLCPLSVAEARHLLALLLFPRPSSHPLIFSWSEWRRRHQHLAGICHSRHRLKAG